LNLPCSLFAVPEQIGITEGTTLGEAEGEGEGEGTTLIGTVESAEGEGVGLAVTTETMTPLLQTFFFPDCMHL